MQRGCNSPWRRTSAGIFFRIVEETRMAVTTRKSAPSKTRVGPYRAAVVHDFGSPLTVEEVPARPLEPVNAAIKCLERAAGVADVGTQLTKLFG